MIRPLLEIELRHDYFQDGVLGGFRVVPDEATARLLARYRLMIRFEQGVFSLLAESADDRLVAYLLDQTQAAPLGFSLVGDQRHFLFITDLPLDWTGVLQLSTGHVKSTAAGPFEMLPILDEQAVVGNRVVATVCVNLHDLLVTGCGTRYVVEFNSRTVHWHYYLINRSEVKLTSPVIVSAAGSVFEGPVTMTLPGREQALHFSSGTEAYPLRQVPDTPFNLVDRLDGFSAGHSAERVLIKGLPTPELGHLIKSSDPRSSCAVCAMYVYV
ncbi:hypothetical protein K0038_01235 [Pseudomonas syringae]|nr:hypothetical protein [Pseudomonas syringae]